jgi:HSP20 family protein
MTMLRSMLPTLNTPRFGSLWSAAGEMDRLFDGFFNANGSREIGGTFLPLTVWEDEKQVYIEAETPGAKIDDIELVFHDGILRLGYTRQAPEGERKYWLNERGYGRFERVIRLPDLVDENSIKAELNAGVLHVTLGKKPELQPRKIAVQLAESQPALEGQVESKE